MRIQGDSNQIQKRNCFRRNHNSDNIRNPIKRSCRYDCNVIESFYKYLKMFLRIAIFYLTLNGFCVCSQSLVSKSRKTAFMHGDILIGTLVSVHHQPKQKTASLLECGEIREQYGIQRVEAAFLAVDRINEDPNILPNITLGIEIRDSCWYSSIALEQSIEFIRDAITGPDVGNNNINAKYIKSPSPGSKNLVGVVGPGSSAVTIQVQNLLQLFRIPQVGYSATSRDLSDKSRFSYFQRVVPSDYYQAQVMVDIVKRFNWTYVSAVHTDGNYGQSGITAFRELADTNNICIAKEDAVLSNAENEAFDEVIRQLGEDNRANVVVCFCEGMTIRNLLKAARRLNQVHRFLFLGSDGWADRSDVVAGLEDTAVGGMSVKIQSSYVTGFDEHYLSLHPDMNDRNPWFREFWEHRFNCNFPASEDNITIDGSKYCSGSENLSDGYKQDTKMAFVEKAIYTMAYGLHNIHKNLCNGTPGLCSAMLPINGSLFRDYLLNVTFRYQNETVSFDSKGDPPGRYDVMNYQQLANGSYDYVKVGSWLNGTLVMNESLVVFKGTDKSPPISVCSKPCDPGQVKSFIDTGENAQKCCWVCNDCGDNEYLENETTCSACDRDHWPNSSKTGCHPIPVEYMDWHHDGSIAAMTIAALGFLVTCFAMAVFLKYNHTPVVKASTRELTYIIFMGMMVSYLSSLPLLHMPTRTTCAFSRIMPGLSFAMVYSALVTKTNRIARILAGNKKIRIRKLKFMSATAQVIITCILISVEALIIIGMLIYQPPEAIRSYPNVGKGIGVKPWYELTAPADLLSSGQFKHQPHITSLTVRVEIVCNTSALGTIAPLGWDFILVVLCTIYAIKTRNLPENFNEAKFIGFSMYTTCVIWLAWVPIYFGSDHKIICMSVCTSLSAFVTLAILFLPKIYIILCRPEKNDRAAFKTATNVRCHIGLTVKHSKDKIAQTPSGGGSSTYHSSADNKWSDLLGKMKGAMHTGGTARGALLTSSKGDHHPPKMSLKRETSVWSDVSVSQASSAVQHRDLMLQRAFGSQLDLDHESGGGRWSLEEKSSQTCDELLDPLIPRMRRRVVRAVREGTLTTAEGREFFSLTHGWMQAQADAAKIEYQKMQELKAEEEAARKAEEEKFIEEERLRRALSKQKKNPWGTVRSEVDKLKGPKQNQSILMKLTGRSSNKSFRESKDEKTHPVQPSTNNVSGESGNPEAILVSSPITDSARLVVSQNAKTHEANCIFTNATISSTITSTFTNASALVSAGRIVSPDNAKVSLKNDNISCNSNSSAVGLIPLEVTVTRFNGTSSTVQTPDQVNNVSSLTYCSPFVELKPSYIFPNNSEKNSIDANAVDSEISKANLSWPRESSVGKKYKISGAECASDKCKLSSAKENELIILGLLSKRSLMKAKLTQPISPEGAAALTFSSSPAGISKEITIESRPKDFFPKDKTKKLKRKHRHSNHYRKDLPLISMSKSQTMQEFSSECSTDENALKQQKSFSDSCLPPPSCSFTIDIPEILSKKESSASIVPKITANNNGTIIGLSAKTSTSVADKDSESHSDSPNIDDTEKPVHCCNLIQQSKLESECETDDSCNIEDFFKDRGLSFDRTPKKAKKL